jgi:hypothetical protein
MDMSLSAAATCDRLIYFELERDLRYAASQAVYRSQATSCRASGLRYRQRTTTASDPVAQAFADTGYELEVV